ncbi:bifunctional proline dehydrogenase/L-glutamate gamma-semialdehyde dehydrogenase [Sulfurimonas sp. SAG-AH-194-C21]|nr:bifunctional proline dehydrogenase/L-glutamate gamma-semialdehyde dehydrogenase [Sulfurimonas sp. SAG-AH-194-C21]MDF1883970.1 bifunctional proline dehydrogenase/L-glutamate gamma-semialdehyde dehydrogenase [Sulfurimonas sp. SAG-AH-194-C21]
MKKEMLEEIKSLSESWQKEISLSRQSQEKKFHQMMIKMLKNPQNKLFLIELLDQSFRASDTIRITDQLEFLFSKYENIEFFSEFEALLIWSFRNIGIYISSISVPLFIDYLRNDISSIVIKGEDRLLSQHLKSRKLENTRVNINIIGEAVLGEGEAKERVEKYIKALQNPDIDYISIKISTIFSQIVPLAHEWSVEKISEQIALIYEAAIENKFINSQGREENKFVNLDMEEYKDINLTVDAFMGVLSQDKFKNLHAGIVLQTYIPDALFFTKKLALWAKERVKNGGAPIKIRVVKGANQEMELTEASSKDWPCVTYEKKSETDTNFKIVLDFLLSPDVVPFVNVGVASHNIFDQAFAYKLAEERGVLEYYCAEMLEGMSESAYRVLKNYGIDVILYAPTATKSTFTNAIAYLVRRFDENTAEQNFLRHSFGLSVEDEAWQTLIKSFDVSMELMDSLPLEAFRTQDRLAEVVAPNNILESYEFENESDTDFSLQKNLLWAETIVEKWSQIGTNGGYHAHSVIAGLEVVTDEQIVVIDKSQLDKNKEVGTYSKATKEDLSKALEVAKEDTDEWSKKSSQERAKILMNVAKEFQKARADLIGIAAAEVGKVFTETDVEISEAIDFLNFYPYSFDKLEELEGVELSEKGVGLVISPWNFPIAIPVGGIAAALASGNRVILKAASDSVLCGFRLCQCFWDAGVSKNTLQFVIADGEDVSSVLVADEDVDFVIFTGSEATAYKMIQTRPNLHISAETGGKDATIVTALADRDQAIKNVVASAFNNSGQKCSATSLLVLEEEVYNDVVFKQTLLDAARSLEVGSVWDLHNKIGTLSSLPSGKLSKALEHLGSYEEWLLKPEYAENNPYMLKPAIRWGTQNGDFTHMNELFGPVLSVMCAKDLKDAVQLVNATGYGLTSGLESLDEREKEYFKENILAGNLYINRMTTGAIVRRQPFGGMRKSSIGSGRKAGGFNYLTQFCKISSNMSSTSKLKSNALLEHYKNNLNLDDLEKILNICANFVYWVDKEFSKEHDYSNIRGESNYIKYIGVKSVLLRVDETSRLEEIVCSIFATRLMGASLHLSLNKETKSVAIKTIFDNQAILFEEKELFFENEDEFIDVVKNHERIRFLTRDKVSEKIYEALSYDATYLSKEVFVSNGRLEMLHYYIEQSISDSYHRYGNLGGHKVK